ncbi:Branched-chain amino acid aminotransferase [Seminavis robusta]|uniref:Branched-chain amino acid aminotransferase n=1 Tax=Seminavis robusta TaxID=568900 RepID=A0A9N8HQE7_9STRA|nr:Branched-chain amino acid aminotransferase [Seminavis robusta]|eukprot:Sro1159_g247540.1 Branched-chain amino acid aminotransferase (403) ;mRNA; r:6430-7819
MRFSSALFASLALTACQGFVLKTPTTSPLQQHTQQLRQGSSLNMVASESLKAPGTAKMDTPWNELGFEFRPTNSHIRLTFKDGEWGKPELVKEPYINLHIGATALHYGQACFEGLKAFAHEDGSVNIFRPDENSKRMQNSCERTLMPAIPTDVFVNACKEVVRDNIEYVPPYGSGGALYIRPLLFGSGPKIGLQPADEYTFLILVIPVGDYYKGGLSAPVDGLLIEDFDRAAPRGVGNVKVAGNYAADLLPNMLGKKKGFPIGLYLDAATQSMVEEFSTSNFVGINNEANTFVTPKSPSVLPSITNKSLMTIAKDEGLKVEARDIPVEELDQFDEVLAVGTAVVVTPVGSITRFLEDGSEKKYEFGEQNGEIGETTLRLYKKVRDIQNGEVEDTYGWNVKVN